MSDTLHITVSQMMNLFNGGYHLGTVCVEPLSILLLFAVALYAVKHV